MEVSAEGVAETNPELFRAFVTRTPYRHRSVFVAADAMTGLPIHKREILLASANTIRTPKTSDNEQFAGMARSPSSPRITGPNTKHGADKPHLPWPRNTAFWQWHLLS
jgi:hypothetical protein